MSKAQGLENRKKFDAFCQERESKQDWGNYIAPDRARLNRTLIADEAGLSSRKLLVGKNANPYIFERLSVIEERLRDANVLAPIMEAQSTNVIERFLAWTLTVSDRDLGEMVYRGEIKRSEVAKAIGCSVSALKQNQSLKAEYERFMESLRDRGGLPPLTEHARAEQGEAKLYDNSAARSALAAKRLSTLERENIELKARIAQLERELLRFTELSEAMTELGVFPQ